MREACFPFFGGYGQSSARKGAMSPGLTGATKKNDETQVECLPHHFCFESRSMNVREC